MTVLMFGWEFPPHISGGLGTACLGLTRSLTDENIHVLFVVPKAYGDEEIKLINAGDCVIPHKERTLINTTKMQTHSEIRTIDILSPLSPYSVHQPMQATEQWNWEFQSDIQELVETEAGIRYNFTGLYGPSLMNEVNRYAEVSSVIAQENTFDVIHAHDWLTYPAGIEAKKISGKPLVIHVHATEFDRAGENVDQQVFEIEKKGMMEADRIIAVSHWTKDIIVSKYGIAASKIDVVHNGVMPPEEFDLSFMPKISDQVVTFLGRITYQKGPQYFIDAAKRVLDHFPEAHFIMAGSGDLLPAMVERVAQMKLSHRIHFTGFLRGKQVHQVWSVTDVYVMPSVSEPFGITPLEAVHAGVPVILSMQSGVAEVIDHAIKVDFWNVDALANAIINVLRHKALSESLRSNSRKEIESLTWKRAAKKIINIYHEL